MFIEYIPLSKFEENINSNLLLIDFIREKIKLTGSHIGCDTSQCGACVVHVGGKSVKSCTMLAVQAEGADVATIEGLASGDEMHPMQAAFKEHHGLQCGFCTPGQVMAAVGLLTANPNPTREEARQAMSGNVCRCGAYDHYLNGIMRAAGEV